MTKSSCNNGVTISFDYNAWSVKTNYSNYKNTDNTRVKCSLYFRKISFVEAVTTCGASGENAANCITNHSFLSNEVIDDETGDHNLRFIGSDPDNYVRFNDELWRIIGVMNNIDDGTGTKETRLKIIRNEVLENCSFYAQNVGGMIYSNNNWPSSTLYDILNVGAYWNRASETCRCSSDGLPTTCDFSNSGLTLEAKTIIGNAMWNLGGVSSENSPTSTFYISERESIVYQGRPTEWTGMVALAYPSDYGYATSGGSTVDRNTCLATNLYSWDSVSDCYNNDWLYDSSNNQWTLTPGISLENVYRIQALGETNIFSSSMTAGVYPSVYLSSEVKITSGQGTAIDPYRLEL